MRTVTEGTPAEALSRCEAHIVMLRERLRDARTDREIEATHRQINVALSSWQALHLHASSPPAV
jgi:hypothetical protein